ncbi:putative addiction module antidote protein [Robbsia andropogonis]|uniref:addiction module antidote protein n=1 Tax=Robbsia andropogonis TaxID=28092 RepID=UPI0020A1AE69|nr:addiction module antidote protein [Robbsia andropogonis]MCP1116946.1 putative addiction module antidote protein [Robbsia andropogonis]MCP1126375.1 putative addiction module antidote protein [Robbsia andropogonis]
MTNFTEFDPSEFLDSEEMIAEFLTASLEHDDPAVFIRALGDVAKARGMTAIAKDVGMGRESLYKALAGEAKPRYETIQKLVGAMGMRFSITPAHAGALE